MATADVARHLVELCRAGRDAEAGERYWAREVVSIEPEGQFARVRGKDSLRAKGEWFSVNSEVHSAAVEGPWVNGDQFAVRFTYDLTPKGRERRVFDEIALYTVKDGHIVEERIFYPIPPPRSA